MRAQVGALRQEVARLQLLLQASEAKVAMWEECMQQLVHCVMLSPDMNDMYKTECSTLLKDALNGVEQIQAVRFVDCSFPSVPAEAPHIQLIRWESMQDSEWQLRWAPSWSVQVAVEGQQYVSFSMSMRLYDLRLSGRITLKMSTDLATIIISFKQPPKLRLKTECTVSWGSVPLPLQTYIEQVVQDEFQRAHAPRTLWTRVHQTRHPRYQIVPVPLPSLSCSLSLAASVCAGWTIDNAVAPNEITLNPTSFQPKQGLTQSDIERAIQAVGLARAISDPTVKAS